MPIRRTEQDAQKLSKDLQGAICFLSSFMTTQDSQDQPQPRSSDCLEPSNWREDIDDPDNDKFISKDFLDAIAYICTPLRVNQGAMVTAPAIVKSERQLVLEVMATQSNDMRDATKELLKAVLRIGREIGICHRSKTDSSSLERQLLERIVEHNLPVIENKIIEAGELLPRFLSFVSHGMLKYHLELLISLFANFQISLSTGHDLPRLRNYS